MPQRFELRRESLFVGFLLSFCLIYTLWYPATISIDGETGITVPPCSPESLAAAVNRLLDNATLRNAYGQAALRRVQNEFNLDLMVRRTLEVYSAAGAEASATYFAKNGAPSPQTQPSTEAAMR